MQNPGDHRIMVPSVGEVDTVGKHLAKRGEGGIVSDVARAEDETSLLLVEFGYLFLELNVVVAGA